MLKFADSRVMNFTAFQLYCMVLDIEKYPEFVPWCSNAKILLKERQEIEAELGIDFGIYSKSYISRIIHGISGEDQYYISIHQKEGPFEYMNTNWFFTKQEKFSTLVAFEMEFQLKSQFIEKILSAVFDNAANSMIVAFEKRAGEIYGKSESIAQAK
ncbi:MAG: type II toxin-antitoxin system RatA family toxin [Rickettsiaceae bacterium]|nr:type II toxin-antitoxin system RatA family toxin [Rickettsiaceae bacterium]